jgi:Cdc6-like AAA superfamily ATPase
VAAHEVVKVSFLARFKLPGRRASTKQPTRVAPPTAATLTPIGDNRQGAGAWRTKLPRFRTTAGDHLDQDQRDIFGRRRVRLRNAFTPAQPVVDPEMFAGRKSVLQMLIRSVEDERLHIVIYGDRGVGKTSLMRMLTLTARDARYIVIYLSCGAQSEFSETFRTAAAEIPLLYHSTTSPISSNTQGGRTVADLFGPQPITPRQFAEAVAKLVGTRVLIVLDEFDRADSREFRRDVAELLKSLSDMSARVQLVIAGVATDVADLIEHIPSVRRSVRAIRIPAMSDEEVVELISNGERNSGLKFEPEATAFLISAADGSPYLTNLLAHGAGMAALDNRRANVTIEDIAFALEVALEDLRGRIPTALARRLDAEPQQTKAEASANDAADGAPSKSSLEPGRGAARLEKVLNKLQAEGFFEASTPTRYALVADTVAPYLQLVTARARLRIASARRAAKAE